MEKAVVSPEDAEMQMVTGSRQESIPSTTDLKTWLNCRDLKYAVGKKGKKIEILHGVNALFPPGRLTALMGPSGSGKTSLLSVLAGRSPPGSVAGAVTSNKRKVTRALMKQESKLVPQHDLLQPALTTRETLTYTAELALDLPRADRLARVQEVLETLSLKECADVLVGNAEQKGLSGGQIKRLSIAVEMISNPSCLMLDEATSGLDSKVAEDVIDLVKALAAGGRTVICTIHQPSFKLFSKFDWMVMLWKGHVAFSGRVDQVATYLEEIGDPCPEFTNPADHLMVVLSDEDAHHGQVFQDTRFAALAQADIERHAQDCETYLSRRSDPIKRKRFKHTNDYPTSYWNQFTTLARRGFYVTWKDKRLFRVRIVQIFVLGFIVSTVFWDLPNLQSRSSDKISVMFLLMLSMTMASVMTTALAMPLEKVIIIREYGSGLYSSVAFFFARLLVLLTFQTLYAMCYSVTCYFTVGFNPALENFVTFVGVILIISLLAGTLGFTAGMIFTTPQQISAVIPPILLPLILFAGFFLQEVPSYYLWLQAVSFFFYAMRIMIINEFSSVDFEPCSVEELLQPTGSCPFGSCSLDGSNNLTALLTPEPCPGEVIFRVYEYDGDEIPESFAVLIGYWIALVLISLLALRRFVKKQVFQ